MVHAYHVIFTAYGFWLPNDPRGSWSEFVGSWELFRFGPATKTELRHSPAKAPHDRSLRLAAKQALKLPDVHFTGPQARAVGSGFKTFVEKSKLIVWACSILPDHVHMVVARHRYEVEQFVNLLKGEATRQLRKEELHPFEAFKTPSGHVPKCWTRGEWKVYLETEEEIVRAIRYVEENPVKEGKPRQRWTFVKPFPGLL